jgi:hypothetical protein
LGHGQSDHVNWIITLSISLKALYLSLLNVT